jgi:hypothetical protein
VLLGGPSPRFGPIAAIGLKGELEPEDNWAGAVRLERLTDALIQRDGVVYDTPIRDWREYRFPDTGLYDVAQFGPEGRYAWQAKALLDSGADLGSSAVTDRLTEPAHELALGLKGDPTMPGNVLSEYNQAGVAFRTQAAVGGLPVHVRMLVDALTVVDDLWTKMKTGTAPPLRRDTAGPLRDFDYNLDGLAHYGMLPDMLQDLKNVGLPPNVINRFFGSAQRYIEVWERCAQVAGTIPHPVPGGP